jgi:hypothetical protein
MYAFLEGFQAGQQMYTVHIPDRYFNATPHWQVPHWPILNQAANAGALLANGYIPFTPPLVQA